MLRSGASINMRGLKKEISSQYTRRFKQIIEMQIRSKVEAARKQLLMEFDNHEVTRDLSSGPGSGNLAGGGDLFSFIGFDASDRPTNALRVYLLRSLRVRVSQVLRNEIGVNFHISLPTKEEMELLSPMPWAPGRSWLREVEMGIPGLGQYLVKESPSSRSGAAIQVKGVVNSNKFGGVPYMTEILGNLIKNLTSSLD